MTSGGGDLYLFSFSNSLVSLLLVSNSPQPSSEPSVATSELLRRRLHSSAAAKSRKTRRRRDLRRSAIVWRRRLLLLPRAWHAPKRPASWIGGSASTRIKH